MLTNEHGFLIDGVVFHSGGLFLTMGGEGLGRVDPSGDVAGHFGSMRIVGADGREWRIASWNKRMFAGFRHGRGGDSHTVELEQVGSVGLEELRARLKAAMTPAVLARTVPDEAEQRQALQIVDTAASIEDLVRALRAF